ncbi:MAG TPA: cytochrome c oxidase subunit 3 [Caulobacteraceae bacterium]|jgi:heme/copper-type cytochrome/quinol oxidase subunit 3|nr:cytochrome c oxidase subunit 3 [Caulobacteraceae bacterium]
MSELVVNPGVLPVGPQEKKSASWWGVLCLVATEASLFAYLLFSYYYYDVQLTRAWRPSAPPPLHLAAPNTVLLLLSSVVVWWGERALKKGKPGRCLIALVVGFLMGVGFVLIQLKEWASKHDSLQKDLYGSIYFTTTGFHMAHVIAGLIALLFVIVWLGLGYFDEKRSAAVSNAAIYWHFVDAVWLTVFFTFYVTPYLW